VAVTDNEVVVDLENLLWFGNSPCLVRWWEKQSEFPSSCWKKVLFTNVVQIPRFVENPDFFFLEKKTWKNRGMFEFQKQ